jgi:putative Mg2+ transporter-C (MgtC) family protein
MFDSLFTAVEIAFIVDLCLAVVIGAAIGAERELRNKDAGISTHIFVITGAMLFTFMSATVDPASKSRIAAQIVSGIGFLGAGLILKDGITVKNLTTAASIWFTGAIGMAIGFGYYVIAIIAAIACTFVPRIPHVRQLPVTNVEKGPKKPYYDDGPVGGITSDD